MPTDAALVPEAAGFEPAAAGRGPADDVIERRTHNRRTLRLGVGVTITFLIALLYDWPLAYLAPIFASPMLQAPAAPSLTTAAKVLLVTVALYYASLFAAGFSQIYPLFFLIVLFPALFWVFRFGLSGGPALITVLALVYLVLTPMVAGIPTPTAEISTEITRKVAWSFVQNIGLALTMAIAMFALVPPLPTEPAAIQVPVLAPSEVTRRAGILTAITGSYTALYLTFGWTNVHSPIYIAIFASSLELSSGSRRAKGILIANVLAGFLAMGLYQLTRMTPYLPFVAVMVLTVNLVLARMITSKVSWAWQAGFALSVLMILYGESLLPFSDAESANFSDRLGELGWAAIWAVGMLTVLQTYFPPETPVVETDGADEMKDDDTMGPNPAIPPESPAQD